MLRRSKTNRDASLIIIATEGSHTEPTYFESLELGVRYKIVTIPSVGGNCSPTHALENLKTYIKRNQIRKASGDKIWLVIDYDRWGEQKLSEVQTQLRHINGVLIVSRPCFEVWLCLHFKNSFEDKETPDSLARYIRSEFGSYSKTNLKTEIYMQHLNTAIQNGKNLDCGNSWPANVNSFVWKIFDTISK